MRALSLPLLLVLVSCDTPSAGLPVAPDLGPVPEGLTEAEWQQLADAMDAESYRLSSPGPTGMDRVTHGALADNRRHGLRAALGSDGVQVVPLAGEAAWDLVLRPVGWGVPGELTPLEPGEPTVTADELSIARGPVEEWWVNEPRGLEQGFTVAHPPAGDDGRLAVELAVEGSLRPELRGDRLLLLDADGVARLAYVGLAAWDADGDALAASMTLDCSTSCALGLEVDTAGADWPVTVDPWVVTQQAKLLASDGAASNHLGFAVDVDGDTAIVGAYGAGATTGAAYVFVRSGATWTEQARLDASDGAPQHYFGVGVSVSGDTAVVGAHGVDGFRGAAYVFTRSGGSWSEQGRLEASDGESYHYFGRTVSLEGDTVLVSASGAGGGTGAAYVFTRGGSTWTEQARLTASDGAAGDYFGQDVSLSGDTALVGAFGVSGYLGAAYVFTRSGSSWSEQAKLLASDGRAGDFLAGTVSLDGDTAVLSAHGDVEAGSHSGSAYVFTRSGTTWTEQAWLTAVDGTVDDMFGSDVAVSGDTVVVGAREDDTLETDSGVAYVFMRSGDVWTQRARLLADDGAEGDELGTSVALSGETAVVGTPSDEAETGAAYVWLVPPNHPPVLTTTALTLVEGGSAVLTATHLAATDEEHTDAELTYTLGTAPAHGQLTLTGASLAVDDTFTQADVVAGSLVYTHDGSQHLEVALELQLTDGMDVVRGTLPVQVTLVDDPPEFLTLGTLTVEEGGTAVLDVTHLDSADEEQSVEDLSFAIATAPAHGQLELDGAPLAEGEPFSQDDVDGERVRYVHDGAEEPTDAIALTLTDGTSTTGPEILHVAVSPVNDAPVAVDDAVSAVVGEAITVRVLDNDSDPEGEALSLSIASAPSSGTAEVDGETLTYTAEEAGTDSLTYEITDAQGATATATVTVEVEKSGCGCTATPTPASGVWVLLGLVGLLRRRR